MDGRFFKFAAAVALGTATMFGATVTVSLGSNPFPTGAIGPYVANINGTNDFVFCDDDTHIVYPNETWTATVTKLSDLVALGNISQSSVMFKNLNNALALYEEAAWLVLQFGSNGQYASGLQNALWDVFLQKAGTGSTSDKTTDAYWLNQAALNYTTLTDGQKQGVVFLTPVANSQRPLSDGTPQEFVMVTPEPGSYALIGTGIILLAIGTFRRKRLQS
jgi:hypothetical protein